MSAINLKKFITSEEVAELLNVPQSTIYHYTHTNKIPFIRKGKRLLFDYDKIINWIEEGSVETNESIRSKVQLDLLKSRGSNA